MRRVFVARERIEATRNQKALHGPDSTRTTRWRPSRSSRRERRSTRMKTTVGRGTNQGVAKKKGKKKDSRFSCTSCSTWADSSCFALGGGIGLYSMFRNRHATSTTRRLVPAQFPAHLANQLRKDAWRGWFWGKAAVAFESRRKFSGGRLEEEANYCSLRWSKDSWASTNGCCGSR